MLRKAVAASSDDTDQNANGGAINLTKADLELGDGGRDLGLRFTGLDLAGVDPADLIDAYIEFTARSGSSGTVSATIKIEDSLSAATFSAADTPADRDTFAFETNWTDSAVPGAGAKFRTDSFAEALESFLVANQGAVSGSDELAFVIEDIGGVRKALSFDGGAAPELVLVFQDDGIL